MRPGPFPSVVTLPSLDLPPGRSKDPGGESPSTANRPARQACYNPPASTGTASGDVATARRGLQSQGNHSRASGRLGRKPHRRPSLPPKARAVLNRRDRESRRLQWQL